MCCVLMMVLGGFAAIAQAQTGPKINAQTAANPGLNPQAQAVGSNITINGSGFTTVSAVQFLGVTNATEGVDLTLPYDSYPGLVQAVTVTKVSTTQLIVKVPVGAVSGQIRVITTGANAGAFTSQQAYPFVLKAGVTSFTPAAAGVGQTVTINGTNFGSGLPTVQFVHRDAPGTPTIDATVISNSETQIKVTVPDGAANGPISVIPFGVVDAKGSSATNFKIMPVITSISPNVGAADGTVEVTINGYGFKALGSNPGVILTRFYNAKQALNVRFDDVDGDRIMYATVPTGAISGYISLTTANGIYNSPMNFYVGALPPPPTVTVIQHGQATQQISITGTNFGIYGVGSSPNIFVSFPNYFDSNTPIRVQADSSTGTVIKVRVPYGATHGTLRVETDIHDITTVLPFYLIPTITSVKNVTNATYLNLPRGILGDVVEIEGVGLDAPNTSPGVSPPAVDFYVAKIGTSVTPDVTTPYTKLRVTVPDLVQIGPIYINTVAGKPIAAQGASANFLAPPQITNITPQSTTTGSYIDIIGYNFVQNATSVRFYNNLTPGPFAGPYDIVWPATSPPATYTANYPFGAATKVTVKVPGGLTAAGPVELTTAYGSGKSSIYFVPANAIPVISSFEVTGSGGRTWDADGDQTATPENLTITGTGFSSASTVRFYSSTGLTVLGTGVVFDPNTGNLTVTTPNNAGITGPIRVTNAAGVSNESAVDWALGVPTIATVTPTTAAIGATVTITGTHFTRQSVVTFTGAGNTTVTATPIEWATNALIRVKVPVGAVAGPITVTTTKGTATFSATTFTPSGDLPTISNITSSADGDTNTRVVLGVSVITVTGTNFTKQSTVLYSTTAGPGLLSGVIQVLPTNPSADGTTLTALVPAGVATGPIRVTNATGSSNLSSQNLVVAASIPAMTPTILSTITPTSGAVGTVVNIPGTQFTRNAVVKFGATTAATRWISSTALYATVPGSLTPGAYTISVETNEGGVSTTVNPTFTVTTGLAPASIISFSPTAVSPLATLTITGAGFNGSSKVYFTDANGLAHFQASNNGVTGTTQLTVQVPASALTGPIRVDGPGGMSLMSATDLIVGASVTPTITAITGLSPSFGPIGTVVTITGTGFTGSSTVTFNGVAATGVVRVSGTQLRATVGALTTTGPVVVTTSEGGASSGAIKFNVITGAPTITALTAPLIKVTGDTLTITGTNFDSTSKIYFSTSTGIANSTPATQTSLIDTTTTDTLSVLVPGSIVTGPIRVDNAAGLSLPSTQNVVIDQTPVPGATPPSYAPTISEITPTYGPTGQTMEITGTNFTAGTTSVTFTGITTGTVTTVLAASVQRLSDTKLRLAVPATGTAVVRVITTEGGSSAAGPVYTVAVLPTITTVPAGVFTRGSTITITGTNFTPATKVYFSVGAESTAYTPTDGVTVAGSTGISMNPGSLVDTATTDTFTVDIPTTAVPQLVQTGQYRVGNEIGYSGLSATSLFLGAVASGTAPAPTVTSISPLSGPVGTVVTITGTNFTSNMLAANVRFGVTAPTVFRWISSTKLLATIGAAAGLVGVNTPESLTFVNGADTFTIAAAVATITSVAPVKLSLNGAGPNDVLTLTGTGFTSTSRVYFTSATGIADLPVTVSSVNFSPAGTLATVVVPDTAISGPIRIDVTPAAGISTATFSVLVVNDSGTSPAPTIDALGLSRTYGPTGTWLTITGTNFTAGATVHFTNGVSNVVVASTSIYNISSNQLRFQTPALALTTPYTVRVLTPEGGAAVAAQTFTANTVVLPTIAAVTPNKLVSPLGTQKVTITSAASSPAYHDLAKVYFTGPAGFAASFPTTIDAGSVVLVGTVYQATVTVPVGVTTGPIRIENPGPVSSAPSTTNLVVVANAGTSIRPTISSLSRTSGPVGTWVVVNGTNFTTSSSVFFNGLQIAAANVYNFGPTQLRVQVPANATTGPVAVQTNEGGLSTGNPTFTVVPTLAPTISNLAPLARAELETLTIVGANFTPNSRVYFSSDTAYANLLPGAVVSSVSASGTVITVTVPVGAKDGPVRVDSDAGSSPPSTQSLVITGGAGTGGTSIAPQVSSISPKEGPITTTVVTIKGSNFTQGSIVYFTTPIYAATGLATTTFVDSTTLRAAVPATATDGVVRVYTPEGGLSEDTGPGVTFTVQVTAVPVISFIGPSAAINPVVRKDGETLSITGTGLTNSTKVYFSTASGLASAENSSAIDVDTVNASTAHSATVITVTVPPEAVSGPIRLKNAAGFSALSGQTLVIGSSAGVDGKPTITGLNPSSGPIGTVVTITGTNFGYSTALPVVNFTSATGSAGTAPFTVPATVTTLVNSTTIRATVPTGTIDGPVRIFTTEGGLSSTSQSFDVKPIALPTITNIGANPVVRDEGDVLTLFGSNFTSTTTIHFTTSVGLGASGGTQVQAGSVNAFGTIARVVIPPGGVVKTGPIRAKNFNGFSLLTTQSLIMVGDSGDSMAPSITSLEPASGPVGTVVNVYGTGFTPNSSIYFNGVAAAVATKVWLSSTYMRVTVPTGAANGPVEVTTTEGGAALSNQDFTVTSLSAAPTIAPTGLGASLPISKVTGTQMTITGTFFTPTSKVYFSSANGIANLLPGVTVDSASADGTTLTVTIPNDAKAGPVRVENAVGSSTPSAQNISFGVPTIDGVGVGVTPTAGFVGTMVTVKGTNFQPNIIASQVKFGGTNSTAVLWVNSTTLRVTAPAATGTITVANDAGTSAASADSYSNQTTAAMTVTSFSPAKVEQGDTLTLFGTGFNANMVVFFSTDSGIANSNPVTVSGVVGTTLATVVVPSGASPVGAATGPIRFGNGPANTLSNLPTTANHLVVVTNSGDSPAPTIAGVNGVLPLTGVTGTTITVTGTNFTPSSIVTINNVDMVAPVFVNSTTLRAQATATGIVRVRTPEGGLSAAGPTFTMGAGLVPSVSVWSATTTATGIFPYFAQANGTDIITVRGTNFINGSNVYFTTSSGFANSAPQLSTFVSATQITVAVPSGAITGPIRVDNAIGLSPTSAQFLIVGSTVNPTVSSIQPTFGAGGTTIEITGTKFGNVTSVTVGTVAATAVVRVSDTLIRATVAAAATAKSGEVVVITQEGTASNPSSSGPNFTVVAGIPTINIYTVSPATTGIIQKANNTYFANDSGTDVITVRGVNFTAGSLVYFSTASGFANSTGVAVTNFVDAVGAGTDTFDVVVPDNAITGPIRVSNEAGLSIPSTQNLIISAVPGPTPFPAAPTISSITPNNGPASQLIEITGTGFTAGNTSVTFTNVTSPFTVNTVLAASVQRLSDTKLRVAVPAASLTSVVKVITVEGGTSANTTTPVYTVLGAPTVTTVPTGRFLRGATITITGTNFTPDTKVYFTVGDEVTTYLPTDGGTVAGSTGISMVPGSLVDTATTDTFSVVIPTTAVPQMVQTGQYRVGNEFGYSGLTTTSLFIGATAASAPAPVVSSISPLSGPAGTVVTITGQNFTSQMAAANVRFGVTAPTAFRWISSTKLLVTVGAAAGLVGVNTPESLTFVNGSDTFTIAAATATLTSAAPQKLSLNGAGANDVLTIQGTGFTSTSQVYFTSATGIANLPVTVSTVNFSPAGTLATVVVPDAAISGPIRVDTTPGVGISTATLSVFVVADSGTSPAPTIDALGLSRTYGPTGTWLTITGTNFTSGTTVSFTNGVTNVVVASTAVFNISSTQIRLLTPALAILSPYTVRVITPEGGAAVAAQTFTPQTATLPTIATVTPNKLIAGQFGQQITITSTSASAPFASNAVVYFSGAGGYASDTPGIPVDPGSLIQYGTTYQVTVTVPTTATTGPIRIENPTGPVSSAPSTTNLVFVANTGVSVRPTITGLSRTSGPIGSWVIVEGTNFTTSSSVFFNGSQVASASVYNFGPTQLRVAVPANSTTGPVAVHTNEGGLSTGNPTFTILPIGVPTITATGLSPLARAEGETLTIVGTNFTPNSRVYFSSDTAYANMLPGEVVSSVSTTGTVITVTVPSGAKAGPVRVDSEVGSSLPSTQSLVVVGTTGAGGTSQAPQVDTISPKEGPITSTIVTIKGSNFTQGSIVYFTVPIYTQSGAATTTFVDSNTLRAAVPATATDGQVRVYTPEGGLSENNTNATKFDVQYTIVPTISWFGPAAAAINPVVRKDGETLSITGTGFTNSTVVYFSTASGLASEENSTAIPVDTVNQLTANNGTVLTVTVPAEAVTGPIRVKNSAGYSLLSGQTLFIGSAGGVDAKPIISGIEPASGPAGTVVTITGSNFGYSTTIPNVYFTSASAPFTVIGTTPQLVNETTIRVVVPAAITGAVRVATTEGGLSATSVNFTVTQGSATGQPTIAAAGLGVTPVRVQTGDILTLTGGTFYTPNSKVYFSNDNGVALEEVAATFISAASISVTVPGNARTGQIRVMNELGLISALSGQTLWVVPVRTDPIPAPTVTSISPDNGPVGTIITITGSGFASNATVTVNGIAATNVVWLSATSLRATVPPTATSGVVKVNNPTALEGGLSANVATPAFSVSLSGGAPTINGFNANPLLAGLDPVLRSIAPNNVLTINGTGFTATSKVYFSTASGIANSTGAAAPTVNPGWTDTTVTVNVPAGIVTGPIRVENANGSSNISAQNLIYVATAPLYAAGSLPTIGATGISPLTGAPGTLITITGTNFTTNSVVYFTNSPSVVQVPAADTYWLNSTTLLVAVPATAKVGPISVATPESGGTLVASTQYFVPQGGVATFNNSTIFTDNYTQFGSTTNDGMGTIAGPTILTINGTNFTPQSQVWFTTSGTPGGTGAASTFALPLTVTQLSGTSMQLTVQVPTLAVPGPLRILNAAGLSVLSAHDWVPGTPTVATTGLSITTGAVGTPITITGTNFSPLSTIQFTNAAGSKTPATDFAYISSTSVRGRVPAGASVGPVYVTSGIGGATRTSNPSLQHWVPIGVVPTISSFSNGVSAGSLVTVNGTGFTPQSIAYYAAAAGAPGTAVAATSFYWISPTQIKFVLPAATAGFLRVANAAGTSAPSATTFTPAIGVLTTTISSITNDGTTTIINGANFGSVKTSLSIAFQNQVISGGSAAVTLVSTTRIDIANTVFTTATTGAVTITREGVVGSPGIVSGAGSTSHFVQTGVPATVSSLSASSGASGNLILINGSGFVPGMLVTVNGVSVGAVNAGNVYNTYLSPTQLRIALPSGVPSSGNITVTYPAVGGAVSATGAGNAFTVKP